MNVNACNWACYITKYIELNIGLKVVNTWVIKKEGVSTFIARMELLIELLLWHQLNWDRHHPVVLLL